MPMRLVRDNDANRGFLVGLKVVPGSSRERIVGGYGESIKVAVTAPPEGGAANRAVIRVFAKFLDLPESAITIEHGHTSPFKTIRVLGTTSEELCRRLAAAADKK